MSVQEAYREYRDGNFRVNRRYQRKLVWTLNEKRKLIDSLLHGYPIPLFLLAVSTRRDRGRDIRVYEIIDGMQRLNAVFSFIENAYDVDGSFFDVSELSRASQLADAGAFQANADPDRSLAKDRCADFLDYQLAVTEFPGTDEDSVNEVFGRINAYGRHLSPQEQRQAGVVTLFASTVRELAAQIRGDASTESLDLADMPQISVDVGIGGQVYGIQADETFWCKQGILRRNQLRESEDEQFLADLVISILKEEAFPFSGKNLDILYDPTTDDAREANELIVSYGSERLKIEVQATISLIQDSVEQVDSQSNALRRIVHPLGGSNPIKTAFYAVFMAFFELCVRQRKTPTEPARIMRALENLQGGLRISAGQIRTEPRQKNIDTTIGLIQGFFEDTEPPAITHGGGSILRFENALRQSKIETAAFECKQGLLTLDSTRREEPGLLDRIINTLCAIANIGPKSSGALFIGVADDDADKERIERLDGVQAMQVGARYCVGVERELPYLSLDLDRYKQRIVSHISSSGLSQHLRTSVLSNIDCINYRGISVICIWIPNQIRVSAVNDVVYVREGSSTKRVEGLTQTQAVMAIFGDNA